MIDPERVGRGRAWTEELPPDAREIPVPASYNDIFPDFAVHDLVGDAWYETVLRVPSRWSAECAVLRFGAATHSATVWVDGTEVVQHEGGFTPFEADVSEIVRPGGEHRITVVVNNELSWDSMPPGYVIETPVGRRQHLLFDFFNYAGLHRRVWLYTTPRAHIHDVTVSTDFSGSTGRLGYEVETEGADGLDVRVAVDDADGTTVARGTGASGTLDVSGVRLWQPGEGYLYTLELGLWDGDALVDAYPLPFGFRTVSVDDRRLLINGEPFYFRGFGKHEDTVVRGRAHDDVFMVHDFALMEWLGANSFRTSHYPYAEEVLEYADRHGFVVIGEAPGVGINSGLAAGVFGAEPFTTFSDETISDATREAHEKAIREMVARDKNHPSIVLWSIANEPESTTLEARSYFEPLVQETRRLDPSRPVAFANVPGSVAELDLITDLFDVVMLNRYFGWYTDAGDLPMAERSLEADLRSWSDKFRKPILITEYGADALPGLHDVFPAPWAEEYQAQVLDMSHRVFDRVDAVVGELVWNFADFATAPGIMRVGGNRKGVFTRDRHPKTVTTHLRQRWHSDPARSP
jgi:beta-glucuronidase